ncbi:MAG: hypothetical protein KDK55_06840 [Chlamydiia bacterium]|nr:hypothetical protein [Chlamydiia bacterium]
MTEPGLIRNPELVGHALIRPSLWALDTTKRVFSTLPPEKKCIEVIKRIFLSITVVLIFLPSALLFCLGVPIKAISSCCIAPSTQPTGGEPSPTSDETPRPNEKTEEERLERLQKWKACLLQVEAVDATDHLQSDTPSSRKHLTASPPPQIVLDTTHQNLTSTTSSTKLINSEEQKTHAVFDQHQLNDKGKKAQQWKKLKTQSALFNMHQNASGTKKLSKTNANPDSVVLNVTPQRRILSRKHSMHRVRQRMKKKEKISPIAEQNEKEPDLHISENTSHHNANFSFEHEKVEEKNPPPIINQDQDVNFKPQPKILSPHEIEANLYMDQINDLREKFSYEELDDNFYYLLIFANYTPEKRAAICQGLDVNNQRLKKELLSHLEEAEFYSTGILSTQFLKKRITNANYQYSQVDEHKIYGKSISVKGNGDCGFITFLYLLNLYRLIDVPKTPTDLRHEIILWMRENWRTDSHLLYWILHGMDEYREDLLHKIASTKQQAAKRAKTQKLKVLYLSQIGLLETQLSSVSFTEAIWDKIRDLLSNCEQIDSKTFESIFENLEDQSKSETSPSASLHPNLSFELSSSDSKECASRILEFSEKIPQHVDDQIEKTSKTMTKLEKAIEFYLEFHDQPFVYVGYDVIHALGCKFNIKCDVYVKNSKKENTESTTSADHAVIITHPHSFGEKKNPRAHFHFILSGKHYTPFIPEEQFYTFFPPAAEEEIFLTSDNGGCEEKEEKEFKDEIAVELLPKEGC